MKKTIEWEPELCKGKDSEFKGTVSIKLPSTPQRYRYIAECGLKIGPSGEVDVNESTMGAFAKMIELAEAHVEKVSIEAKDGTKYSKYEDLLYDSSAEGLLMELASKILGGFGPSKNSKGASSKP